MERKDYMFKTVIIDDEPIIRKGIRSVINWEELGCTISGEAGDGLQGREIIKQLRPDIIITDIKMPQVDGLSMVREIRDIVPDCKIIILTGYRDFDYAYQAIKLEAFDFILKPTRIEQLYDVVRRAVESLRARASANTETERLKGLYEKNLPLIREKFLYNLLTGVTPKTPSTVEESAQLGLKLDRFLLVVAESEDERAELSEEGEGSLCNLGIASAFEETFSEDCKVLPVTLNSRRTAFIVTAAQESALMPYAIRERCETLQQVVLQCFGFTVSLAVSGEGCELFDLPVRFRECCEAFKHKFYLGDNAVIFHEQAESGAVSDGALYILRARLFECVKAGDQSGVSLCVDELLSCMNGMGLCDREYIRKFYFDTITVINTVRTSALIENDSLTPHNAGEANLYQMIERCDSTTDLNGLLESLARRAAAKISDYSAGSLKLLLRKAVDYLNKHYAEPVTLGHLAGEVYASPSYISRLFKKELGVNFVDYLNEIRVGRAKDLLSDPMYKTYEVAELVGIPNPHYFSKLFKRYVGMTPSEYRELLGESA